MNNKDPMVDTDTTGRTGQPGGTGRSSDTDPAGDTEPLQSTASKAPTAAPRRAGRTSRQVIVPVLFALCVAAAAAATAWLGSWPYDIVSSLYPGDASVTLMAAMRAAAMIAGSVTVGAAVFATFFVGHSGDGLLGARGYAATRLASRAATVWAAAAAVMILATAADGAGVSISEMMSRDAFLDVYAAVEQPKSWTVAFVLAVVVAVVLRMALRWMTVLATLGLSLPAALAPGMVGNNGQGLSHDLATNFLILHSAAAAVWLGVLVAAWSYLRAAAPNAPVGEVLRRVRWCTAGVVVLLGLSGAGITWLQLRGGDLTSAYGVAALAQTAATVLLAVLAVARVRRPVKPGAGPRQLLPDLVLVLAAFAAAAFAGRVPSPSLLRTATTGHEIYIGYDIPGPWTWTGLVTEWRVDALWLTIAVVMLGGYLLAVRRLHRTGGTWPAHRTWLWAAGWVLIALSTSSGVNTWSSAQFSMHMVLHLILNLAAAPMLVAAAPLGLIRAATPPRPGGISGPREWVDTFTRSGLVRMLTTPWVALTIYVVTLFGFYFTPLFDDVIRYHWGHQWMNIHFLVTGCLFFWPIVGAGLPGRRLGNLGRIGMLLAIMPFHALFGIVVMTSDTVLGNTFYQAFDLLDADGLLHDQMIGGLLAWVSGEIPVLIAVTILLVRWFRREYRAVGRAPHSGDGPGGTASAEDADGAEALLDELQRIRR
ncbi:cytochrome c oxidase assembly protein [Tomitella fengzijianii]|uniref:Copper resistance protein D n=1 Tax=Tomitella fengzijianii TaxID=2597660 RepID=A0A516X0T8_9ACTN|nr:cytochrome c oxidase assembly protein [Tomitella fengzijianii]QDQ96692.1 hypothetical protein FO059_04190 [Tomitella fengzijianii]